jgi:hypothetical protein
MTKADKEFLAQKADELITKFERDFIVN